MDGATGRDDSADAVLAGMLAVGRVMVALTARVIAQLDADLTLPQYRLMVVLASRGPQRTRDLAMELGVTSSTATRNCDRLVRRGLLQRFQRPEDRRVTWVSLTDAGKTLIGDAMRHRRAHIAAILSRTPVGAAADVAAVLESFARAGGEPAEVEWWHRWAVSAAPQATGEAAGGTLQEAARSRA